MSKFFDVFMPYGFAMNEEGDWMAFNREYMPIGSTKKMGDDVSKINLPIYTKLRGLTESKILSLAARDGLAVQRNEKGKIVRFWLYNTAVNPPFIPQTGALNLENWQEYSMKLQTISKLKVGVK